MSPREVSKQLRIVQEAYKDAFTPTFQPRIAFTPTFQPRIADMARDAAVASFPCNECALKNCSYKPSPGQTIRYNCASFLKGV